MHFSYHREKKKSRDLSVSDILSPGRWSITDQKSWIGTCDNIKKVEQNNNVIKWNEMTGPYVSHLPRSRLLALLPAWASSHFPDLRPGIGFSSDPPIISFCSEGGGDRFDHSKSMPRTCPVWAPRNLELLGPSFRGFLPVTPHEGASTWVPLFVPPSVLFPPTTALHVIEMCFVDNANACLHSHQAETSWVIIHSFIPCASR